MNSIRYPAKRGFFEKRENLFKFWKPGMLYAEFHSGDQAGKEKQVLSPKANKYNCETKSLAERN